MVGVPGRSKGCVTCRKRKKGCDLAKPACGQCNERGIVCGGYDSDRIFIYQANEKRKKDTPPARETRLVPVKNAPHANISASRQPRPFSVVLPEALQRSAYTEKVLDAFISMYIPHGEYRASNADSQGFVDVLPLMIIRDRALQMAVLAIGTAALGRTTEDPNLNCQASTLYGKALTETAVALRDPIRANSEAMMLVPRTMALFEILFGADKSVDQATSWLSHAIGEMALIISRGPASFSKDDAAHSLFVNARFRLLISAVRTRKATILNTPEWKTLPWGSIPKTANDTLCDIFCGVPELMEAMELIVSGTLSPKREERLRTAIITKAWALHLQLQDWIVTNRAEVYTPEILDSMVPLTFPSLEIACQTVRYWVIALLIYSNLDFAANVPETPTSWTTTHPDRPHPRMFARLLARSASYLFQERHGIMGATAMSFPLGMTLFYMSRNRAADGPYLGMIMKAWNDPNLPSAIRDFLASLKQGQKMPPLPPKVPVQVNQVYRQDPTVQTAL
ncbi:hypothetical protein [Plenodomus lingam JN3]|uniref:Zn(2)-C6 fungal-type domain-containing protein n=1 Tax=Leptosphaeria maculans (strain JN3 / isolate v23.1.3 / race Av1-4-5-6-7-8) TaxID=985895 RepID=M1Z7T1_LEPMJ|nr:hypothetical protein [Plenodomus lingam JN3]